MMEKPSKLKRKKGHEVFCTCRHCEMITIQNKTIDDYEAYLEQRPSLNYDAILNLTEIYLDDNNLESRELLAKAIVSHFSAPKIDIEGVGERFREKFWSIKVADKNPLLYREATKEITEWLRTELSAKKGE